MKIIKIFLIIFIFTLVIFHSASAQISCGTGSLCNPIGSNSLDGFIRNVLSGLAVLLGAATVGMVLYSAFKMVLSQGNEESISKAKTSFQWTIIGFVLTVCAFVIVTVVSTFFGAQQINPTSTAIQSPIVASDYAALLTTLFTGALTVIGTISLLFIIINSIRYLTARGNDEQAATAKRGLTWAIGGLMIALLAYVIVSATLNLLDHDFYSTGGKIINSTNP